MDNYIIELRNKDFLKQIENQGANLQDGFTNGVWTNNLQEKLTLEEGDTLICRNSYIDTKAESQQKIVIEEDLPIQMDFMYYANNWNGALRKYTAPNWNVDPTSVKNTLNPVANTQLVQSDGEMYVACNKTTTGSNFQLLPKITYQGQDAISPVGNFQVAVRFQGLDGRVDYKVFFLPRYFEVGFGTEADVVVNIVFDKTALNIPGQVGSAVAVFATKLGRFDVVEPDLTARMDGTPLVINDTKILALTGAKNLSGDVYHPVTSTRSITLPKGNYDANELCEVVNSLLTTSGTADPVLQNLTQNNLLISVGGTDENSDTPNEDLNHFIRMGDITDPVATYGWEYTKVGSPNILGASQVVLAFDDDTNRFSFQYLHTPVYCNPDLQGGGDAILGGLCSSTLWEQQVPGTANPSLPTKRFRCAKNGGILLTQLSPPSFWADQLGFDIDLFKKDQFGKNTSTPNPDCILVSAQPLGVNLAGETYSVSGQSATIPIFNVAPTDGVHMTSGFVGINSLFEKGNKFQKQVAQASASNDGSTGGNLVTLGTATNDIRAGDGLLSVTQGVTQFGYFLIEVQASFANNYINPEGNFKHITAIVSRYYDKNSYTSSTSADSIIYTHKGQPVAINSFNCRILNSDKTLANNIGQDNTIILEIIKADKSKQNK